MEFQKNVLLSDHTTIGLGGKAELFISCNSDEEISGGLEHAGENGLLVQVLSGGSNIIFPDNGYEGIVLKVDTKGIEFTHGGDFFYVIVKSGENWDELVRLCIEKELSGIECLSGIPGSVGATPIQNVGAYGQEVNDVIYSVTAIDRYTGENITFMNKECEFGYRQSRFKGRDKDKYIITEVLFRFEKNKQPEIKYPELEKKISSNPGFKSTENLKNKLNLIRNNVLELRKAKSMIIDKADPNSKSCGSFFMNPVLSKEECEKFLLSANFDINLIPIFRSGDNYKLSAAWLLENAGYHKGFTKGGVGISSNHSLALININGTTKELLNLAEEIQMAVHKNFGIQLLKEPVVVL